MFLKGWVRHIRPFKHIEFLLLSIPLTNTTYKLVNKNYLREIKVGDYLSCEVHKEPKQGENWILYDILYHSVSHSTSHKNFLDVNDDTKIKLRHLYFRDGGLSRIIFRSKVINSIFSFYNRDEWCQVHTPLLTVPVSEGAGCIITQPNHLKNSYSLPQSPQIYKQILMYSGLVKYWQIAPCFRDEDTRSNRMLEFYQLDVEAATTSMRQSIVNMVRVFLYLCKKFKVRQIYHGTWQYQYLIKLYGTDSPNIEYLYPHNVREVREGYVWICKGYLPKNIHLHKGIRCVRKLKETFVIMWRLKTSVSEINSWIDREFKNRLNWYLVVGYPVILDGDFSHNPFSNYNGSMSEQYDIVVNGEELGGGSIRTNNVKKFIRMWKQVYSDIPIYIRNMLSMMSQGTPVHGGFAIGMERLLRHLWFGLHGQKLSIRDFCPFPLSQNGKDLMLT